MHRDRKIQKTLQIFAVLAVAIVAIAVQAPFAMAEQRIGRESGEPLPRFVTLKDATVNMRVGPGKAYAVKWVLHRRHMPVRVIGEHGHWRRVELIDGDKGWIHRALLTSRRHAVPSGGVVELYSAPEPTARLVARVEPETPIRLLACDRMWCRGEVEGKRGWAPKRNLWGVASEAVFD